MTLTLQIPDDLATQLAELTVEERNSLALQAIRQQLKANTEDDYEDEPNYPGKFPNPLRREDCTDEEIAAIEKGLADIEAGRTIPAATVFAELRQQLNIAPRK